MFTCLLIINLWQIHALNNHSWVMNFEITWCFWKIISSRWLIELGRLKLWKVTCLVHAFCNCMMFLKNHLLPCSSWIVKIHHVHEFPFCLMFLKNLSLAFGSWIFILLDFLKNHSLAYLMNFGFVWCFWKITHLLGSSWLMLLKIHSIVWFITFGFELCSWESFLLGCSCWIMKMPYSWKSWINLAYEF